MPRKVGHVIHDILEAIDRVDEVTRGKTLPPRIPLPPP